ncbi:hypothetical protein Pyrde_1328 [Pyrodictium delaneyi]|uniref:V-ATPase proteolipid subunit C-like domain-containing protein n=2 Tax=Pyrodictium delaneyi TaxID=1273541 RepID=A0A0P0N4J7_9CREN|nr:ATP synthase subunit C [Pyrodictium delaneyi]ALL01374.1 hypothetical protein Pyrde_1328 [Pyrodictium delaneyi]
MSSTHAPSLPTAAAYAGFALVLVAALLTTLLFFITRPLIETAIAAEGAGGEAAEPGLVKMATVLAASLAFSTSVLGAAIGIALVGSASISAMVEKPELRVWGLILTALAEALAIYGIAIAFLILTS